MCTMSSNTACARTPATYAGVVVMGVCVFSGWWYTIWFKIRPLSIFGRSYAVGVFRIV